MSVCKLRNKCPLRLNPPKLYKCCIDDCKGYIHEACSKLILDRYSVPLEDRPEDGSKTDAGDPFVFCTKTCFMGWMAAKKRALKASKKGDKPPVKKRKTPWEEDGSLNVLLDWLTTEGNYARYCGANSNKSGTSKTQYQKDLAELIKSKVPTSERDKKDVENKITSLERQFRTAFDWTQETGQGVEDEQAFESYVLKLCPLFRELEPIMGERPNAKPLSTNESDISVDSEESDDEVVVSGTAVEQSAEADALADDTGFDANCDDMETPTSEKPSADSSKKKSSSGAKRLTASVGKGRTTKAQRQQSTNEFISTLLGDDSESGEGKTSYHQLRIREVEAKELEAQASSQKARKEVRLLEIEETVKTLMARKQLIDSGACTEAEVDDYLPLPKKKKHKAQENNTEGSNNSNNND